MTQQRSNDEIRADVRYLNEHEAQTGRRSSAHVLLTHDVEPLLARVLELEQENERQADLVAEFRKRDETATRVLAEWKGRADRAEAIVARQLGDCTGCTTEPEETCPRDGRTYTEWVNIASEAIGRENAARDVLEQAAHWHVYESHDIGEAFLADTVRDWVDEMAAALAAGLSLQEEQE